MNAQSEVITNKRTISVVKRKKEEWKYFMKFYNVVSSDLNVT